jgi:hypothetical protein
METLLNLKPRSAKGGSHLAQMGVASMKKLNYVVVWQM